MLQGLNCPHNPNKEMLKPARSLPQNKPNHEERNKQRAKKFGENYGMTEAEVYSFWGQQKKLATKSSQGIKNTRVSPEPMPSTSAPTFSTPIPSSSTPMFSTPANTTYSRNNMRPAGLSDDDSDQEEHIVSAKVRHSWGRRNR